MNIHNKNQLVNNIYCTLFENQHCLLLFDKTSFYKLTGFNLYYKSIKIDFVLNN